ncbi:MAG TPA: hypothetical protein VME45_14250 [Stellaceae bacterium]|nr:hypothetical protein [Stellaceae bacterium]
MKTILLAALLLGGSTLAASAQALYQPPAPYGYAPLISPAQALPPLWSYDPYTSGQTACPQKRPGDTQPCSQIMPPTSGQPSYWPR